MPPEAPPAASHLPSPGNAVFYRLFRLEYLKLRQSLGLTPLSPDALSGWSKGQLDAVQHNEEVLKATRMLLKQVVPAFAQRLLRQEKKSERLQVRPHFLPLQTCGGGGLYLFLFYRVRLPVLVVFLQVAKGIGLVEGAFAGGAWEDAWAEEMEGMEEMKKNNRETSFAHTGNFFPPTFEGQLPIPAFAMLGLNVAWRAHPNKTFVLLRNMNCRFFVASFVHSRG